MHPNRGQRRGDEICGKGECTAQSQLGRGCRTEGKGEAMFIINICLCSYETYARQDGRKATMHSTKKKERKREANDEACRAARFCCTKLKPREVSGARSVLPYSSLHARFVFPAACSVGKGVTVLPNIVGYTCWANVSLLPF